MPVGVYDRSNIKFSKNQLNARFKKGMIPWNNGLKGYNSGENSPTWKGGKPNCIDCGKILSSYAYFRCRICNDNFNKGENHPSWKGEKAKYSAIHMWIKYKFGKPKKCYFCLSENRKMYHWANISGKYKRDIRDWIRLCVPCHKRFDIRRKKCQK